MKRKLLVIGVCLLFAIGLLVTVYPFISNYLYENRQDGVIQSYKQAVSQSNQTALEEFWQEAWDYNKSLLEGGVALTDPFTPDALMDPTAEPYASLLNVNGDGVMGYLEIPKIQVYLAVYHGTTEEVLQKGIGHLESTSLPVGGQGSHVVVSGHTGLSDKKLFTDLTELEAGDVFYLHILNEILAYQVDQIKVVEPSDTSDLLLDAQHDYVTLVTCTPYGVNTHRLLVRGTRIAYEEAEKMQKTEQNQPSSSQWMRQYKQSLLVGLAGLAAVLALWLVIVTIRRYRRRKEGRS